MSSECWVRLEVLSAAAQRPMSSWVLPQRHAETAVEGYRGLALHLRLTPAPEPTPVQRFALAFGWVAEAMQADDILAHRRPS